MRNLWACQIVAGVVLATSGFNVSAAPADAKRRADTAHPTKTLNLRGSIGGRITAHVPIPPHKPNTAARKDAARKELLRKELLHKELAAKNLSQKDVTGTVRKDVAPKDVVNKDVTNNNIATKDIATKDAAIKDAATKDAVRTDAPRAESPGTEPGAEAKQSAHQGTASSERPPTGEAKPAQTTPILGNIPAPGTSISLADALVSEKLKDLLTKKIDRLISRKRDHAGVEAFYKDRGYAPLWSTNGAPNARSATVATVMRGAEADGLDPSSYRIPDFKAGGGDPEKLANADLKLTDAVLTYARQAQAGRFSAERLTSEIEASQVLPDAKDVLHRLATATNTASALTSYNPPQAGYKALRVKLAELRANPVKVHAIAAIPAGPVLKPGAKDPRVPLLRKRLGVAGPANNLTYDATLVAAVRKFQTENSVQPTGMIGRLSLEKLNEGSGPQVDPIEAVIANMERWRWLPRDLGGTYVMVNIPDYTLKVVHGGKEIWTTRVVVGKAATPTPIFSAQIDNILLNPTWHVPESIIYNEYLPALQRDPRILDRMGLVLERGPDGKPVVKQPPGEENALGRMKFNFPNRFQVYLHDTPQKKLFKLSKRAFSHGCMRVEDPAKFGEVLLAMSVPQEHYTEERLKQAWGGNEQWLKLRRKIPVHLVYMTAYVDDQGKLITRDDIYGFDKKTTAILKGDPRVLAEVEAEPKKPEISDQQRHLLERYVGNTENGNFFDRHFAGPVTRDVPRLREAPPPQPRAINTRPRNPFEALFRR